MGITAYQLAIVAISFSLSLSLPTRCAGCSITGNVVAPPFREPHCQNYLIGVPTDWGEMSDLGEIPRG
jgi:hypothetical protein